MRVNDVPLVERDGELRIIDSAVKGCQQGIGQLLLIEGASGLGKTAMLDALKDRAAERGISTLHAKGHEMEKGFPYGVIRQLFEGWLVTASPEEQRRVLRGPARLANPLLEYGSPGPLAADDADGRHAFLNGLYWMCVQLAEHRPLVLLLDDIHWADPASLLFLHYLAARLDDQPILLAVTTDLAEWDHQSEITHTIVSNPAAQLIRLAPLSEAGVRTYVRERMGEGYDLRLAEACYQATGGVAFFLHELLGEITAMSATGRDFPPERVFDLAPPKIVRGVLRRLSLLPPPAVELIEAMSVLGAEADLKLAIDISGIDQRFVAEALGALADFGLLHPGVPPRFVYSTVRAAIYQNLSVSTRNAAHAQTARLLTAAAAPLDEIAHHLLRADVSGDPTVVTTLRRAARKAVAENRAPTAATYLTRALQESPAPEEMVPLLVELGRAERRSQLPKALDHLSQAMELSDDPVMRAWVGLDLASGLVAIARHEDAVTVLEGLRKEIDDQDEQLGALLDIGLVSAASQVSHLRSRATKRLRILAEDSAAHPDVTRLLATFRAIDALRGEEPAQRVEALTEEALVGVLDDDFRFHVHDVSAYQWCEIVCLLVWCDRLTDADRLLSRALADAQGNGMLLAVDIYYALRSWIRSQCGRLADAESDARKALGGATVVPSGFRSPTAAFAIASLVEVLTARHEIATAKALLQEYEFSETVGRSVGYSPVMFARARMHAADGDWDAAIDDILHACQLGNDWDMRNAGLIGSAEAVVMLAEAGQSEEAHSRAEALLPRARAFGAPRAVASALRASALADADTRAIGRLEQAVDLLAHSEARMDHATALVDLGGALRRAGRLEQARRKLSSGLLAAQNCGAWGLMKVARSELSAMGVRVRVPEAGAGSLSPQERRVAELAAEGKRNRDIAQTLFVTVKTVEWHLNRVYRKLGIASRDALRKALNEEYTELANPAPVISHRRMIGQVSRVPTSPPTAQRCSDTHHRGSGAARHLTAVCGGQCATVSGLA